jgi:hypothetical protein
LTTQNENKHLLTEFTTLSHSDKAPLSTTAAMNCSRVAGSDDTNDDDDDDDNDDGDDDDDDDDDDDNNDDDFAVFDARP